MDTSAWIWAGDSGSNVRCSDRLNSPAVLLYKYIPVEFTIIKSGVMTVSRSPWCRTFSRAVMDEKSLPPPPAIPCRRGGEVAAVTNNCCIIIARNANVLILTSENIFFSIIFSLFKKKQNI